MGLYAGFRAVQQLSSESLFEQILGGIYILILTVLIWSGYVMLRYPMLCIYEDHVSRYFAWPKSASIPFAEITGIQWQRKRYISFATNVPKSYGLYLAHLNRASRTQIRTILAEKMNMPELTI